MSNILTILQRIVMENKSRTAIDGESPVTYSTLWSRTDAFAGGLQDRDITAGDAVAIGVSNPRAFLVALYGTLRNGCIPVTVPSEYSTRDIVSVLDATGATAYVTDETPFLSILHGADDVRLAITVDCDAQMGVELSTFLENDGINSAGSRTGIDIVSQSDTDPGLIAYVGYEDREPLGIVYTHATLAAAAERGGSHLEPDEPTHLGVLPLSNPLELLYGVTGTILDGGTYVPHISWDPETVRSILYTERIRTFVTPRQYETLLSFDTPAEDAVAVIEPTSSSLESAVDGAATRVRGRPETGLTHVRTPDDADANRLGNPLPGIETRLIEGPSSGELAVAGPTTMDGYVDRPTLTEDRIRTIDGQRWVRTGLTECERTDIESV
ncbi:long-chain fatty acid--CoA ligase [Salinadaptatus halalkaliphilus]|uniref:Long-chain fatty acid--CoA ligase n=1 Tax=Salinadaptatus halalkaliphilus TaxID=2419781 RepID=A0A4S3TQF7_9EURY|nr:class I adenylate-forming enzyme family protein [Salinadaptatus halalkaliphilus]THE64788.1 long-chain fatty acid--CoA ligase [Salinadaptatus halalkaliphilus]